MINPMMAGAVGGVGGMVKALMDGKSQHDDQQAQQQSLIQRIQAMAAARQAAPNMPMGNIVNPNAVGNVPMVGGPRPPSQLGGMGQVGRPVNFGPMTGGIGSAPTGMTSGMGAAPSMSSMPNLPGMPGMQPGGGIPGMGNPYPQAGAPPVNLDPMTKALFSPIPGMTGGQ